MTLTVALICSTIGLILYARLVRPLELKKLTKFLLLIPIALLGCIPAVVLLLSRGIRSDSPEFLVVQVSYYLFSFTAILIILIIIRDVFCFFARILRALRRVHTPQSQLAKPQEDTLSRRKFLKSVSSGVIAGSAAIITPISASVARNHRIIKKVDIFLPNLPTHLEGVTIAHLSDIHVGNTIGKKLFEDIVEETNLLNPDLVAITGDLVDGYPDIMGEDLSPLTELKTKYGVYYCTGNHEHMWDGEGWCRVVESYGVHVLRNAHEMIEIQGKPVAVAGAYDISVNRRRAFKSQPDVALSGIPEDVFKIMLVHQPKSVDISLESGANLVLVGHTHGGQCFPLNLLNSSIHKYARGLYRVGTRAVFVSCGTGYWGPPLRLAVPPEIVLLTLKSE